MLLQTTLAAYEVPILYCSSGHIFKSSGNQKLLRVEKPPNYIQGMQDLDRILIIYTYGRVFFIQSLTEDEISTKPIRKETYSHIVDVSLDKNKLVLATRNKSRSTLYLIDLDLGGIIVRCPIEPPFQLFSACHFGEKMYLLGKGEMGIGIYELFLNSDPKEVKQITLAYNVPGYVLKVRYNSKKLWVLHTIKGKVYLQSYRRLGRTWVKWNSISICRSNMIPFYSFLDIHDGRALVAIDKEVYLVNLENSKVELLNYHPPVAFLNQNIH